MGFDLVGRGGQNALAVAADRTTPKGSEPTKRLLEIAWCRSYQMAIKDGKRGQKRE